MISQERDDLFLYQPALAHRPSPLRRTLHSNKAPDGRQTKVPAPIIDPPHQFGSLLTDLVREVSAKSVDSGADTFVANIYAGLVQKVFDLSKRKRKSDIQQHA